MQRMVVLLFIFSIMFTAVSNAQDTTAKKYTRVPAGYLMVLRQGDSVFAQLEAFAIREKIPSANFSGMGFLSFARFGFFNAQTKEYDPRDFSDVELASMLGSIAWEAGKPSLHAHAVVGDKNMSAFGGHLLTAQVGTGSLEILITVHDNILERKFDEALGARVLGIAP